MRKMYAKYLFAQLQNRAAVHTSKAGKCCLNNAGFEMSSIWLCRNRFANWWFCANAALRPGVGNWFAAVSSALMSSCIWWMPCMLKRLIEGVLIKKMSLALVCWHKTSTILSLAAFEIVSNALDVSDISLQSTGTNTLGCVGDLSGAQSRASRPIKWESSIRKMMENDSLSQRLCTFCRAARASEEVLE